MDTGLLIIILVSEADNFNAPDPDTLVIRMHCLRCFLFYEHFVES